MKLRLKLNTYIRAILIGMCAMTTTIWGHSVDYNSLGQSAAGMIQVSGSQGSKTIPTPNQLFSMPMHLVFSIRHVSKYKDIFFIFFYKTFSF